jgi:DDE superfamily endonuclease
MGLSQGKQFHRYHRVLNRAKCSGRAVARVLLSLLVGALAPDGPLVLGVDETLERRWGKKIAAKEIYRDPVHSSHEHFVKASALCGGCV